MKEKFHCHRLQQKQGDSRKGSFFFIFYTGIPKSFKCEWHIIMQMQYTKNLKPRKFELVHHWVRQLGRSKLSQLARNRTSQPQVIDSRSVGRPSVERSVVGWSVSQQKLSIRIDQNFRTVANLTNESELREVCTFCEELNCIKTAKLVRWLQLQIVFSNDDPISNEQPWLDHEPLDELRVEFWQI